MSYIARIAAFSFYCFLSVAYAAPHTPATPGKASIPGTYYLQGPGEIGSELVLRENGTYSWMLVEGAHDYANVGTWETEGDGIKLIRKAQEVPVFRLTREGELRIKKAPALGKWVATVGILHVGPVADVDVMFVSHSGKSAIAQSIPNGDAIVDMEAGEKWVRTGLRVGSDKPWQWVDIPAKVAEARIAGFAISNPQSLTPAGFDTLNLHRTDGGYMVSAGIELRGVYVRPVD